MEVLLETCLDRSLDSLFVKRLLIFPYAIVGLWHWGRHAFKKQNDHVDRNTRRLRIVDIAGFGLLTAIFLT